MATKELPLSQGAVEGSDPSAQRERSSRLEEMRPSKGARDRSSKTESRKEVGSRTLVGPAGQAITDPSRKERSSYEKEKDLEGRAKSASKDRSEELSQSPGFTAERSAQETSSKDAEEVDPARAIDWLLEKRGDKK